MSWREVSLDEIFEISSSKRVLKKDWKDHGIPFYRTREIVSLARNGVAKGDVFISEEKYEHYKLKYGVPTVGDILVSAIGSLGIAYAVKPHDKFYFKDASVLKLSPKTEVCTAYILHTFRTRDLLDQINSVSGSTVGTLTISRACRLKIPLPPLAEQKRIAAILDQADAIRRQRQRALDRLNQLGQSIFYEMFGDPRSVNEAHPLKNLIKVSSGDGLSAKNMIPGAYPVYGGNGVNGFHNDFNVPEDTIVIGRVGVYCGSIHRTTSDAWITDNALIVTKLAALDNTYLEYALREANFNQYAGRSAQPLVSGSRIYPVKIAVPDTKLQEQFATLIEHAKSNLKLQQASGRAEQTLFSSLQQRAFRGELS